MIKINVLPDSGKVISSSTDKTQVSQEKLQDFY